jgi:hypothetical protein
MADIVANGMWLVVSNGALSIFWQSKVELRDLSIALSQAMQRGCVLDIK